MAKLERVPFSTDGQVMMGYPIGFGRVEAALEATGALHLLVARRRQGQQMASLFRLSCYCVMVKLFACLHRMKCSRTMD